MSESNTFLSYGCTDVGKVRKNNEDSYIYKTLEYNGTHNAFLMAVADGMGGHAAGEVASAKAIEVLQNNIKNDSLDLIPTVLKKVVEDANTEIFKISSDNSKLMGMGTTCTALVYFNGIAHIAHVGDSRAYIIRNETIKLLTKDHTVAQELLDSGSITNEVAKTCPERNILLRAVGTSPDINVDIYSPIPTSRGDIFLICSDGLTEYLDKEEIKQTIIENPIDKVCNILVETANQRGGSDNITVQIALLNENNDDNSNVFSKIRKLVS